MQHCTIHSRIVTAFWQKHVSKGGYHGFHGNGHQGYSSGCGGSSAAHRARRTRAAAFTGSDRGDPRLLPLRFHGELLGRNARRQGRAGMPQAQPRQSFGILQNGGERDYTGAAAPAAALPAAALPPRRPPGPRHHRRRRGCSRLPAAKPTPRPTAKLAPSAPPAAAARTSRLQRPRRHAAACTGTPNVMVLPPSGGAAHRPHLRGRPASALRRRSARWRTDHRLPDAQSGRPVAALQECAGDGASPLKPNSRGLMPTNPPYRPGARLRSATSARRPRNGRSPSTARTAPPVAPSRVSGTPAALARRMTP